MIDSSVWGHRGALASLVLVVAAAATGLHCSGPKRETVGGAGSLEQSLAAARLDAIAARFPGVIEAPKEGPARVSVTLGETAASPVVVGDVHSKVEVSFRLLDAEADALVAVEGAHLARGPLGSELIQRVRPSSVEDFFFFVSEPGDRVIRYAIDVSAVAGLRLVGDTLELLNEAGDPRLRVARPYIIDAEGVRHEATLSVGGCAVDQSARAPWGRAVVAPGAASCTLDVAWPAGLAYPALLDPQWESTANAMVDERRTATASELHPGEPDSIILIAGGYDGSTGLASCELFNPLSRTFALTGALASGRGEHAATSLRATTVASEGEPIAVVGGRGTAGGANVSTNILEVYNPETGLFASAATATAKSNLTATFFDFDALLGESKVLFAGGEGAAAPVATAQVYTFTGFNGAGTVATGTIVATANSMSVPRAYHSGTLLKTDGNVLIAGGYDVSSALSSAELYNPTTNAFEAITVDTNGGRQATMGIAKMRHTATLVPQTNPAHVLVILTGGTNGAGASETTVQGRIDVYIDAPAASPNDKKGFITFSTQEFMQVPRADHRAGLLPNKQLVVTGGRSALPAITEDSVEAITYNEASGDVASVFLQDMDSPRHSHISIGVNAGATTSAGRGILVAGGNDGSNDLDTGEVLVTQLGESCAEDAECESGICVDNVCCDQTCTEICKSCIGAENGGFHGLCRPRPDTVLLEPECADEVTVTNRCDGLGGVEVDNAEDCKPSTCNATNDGCSTSCLSNADCSETGWCDLSLPPGTGGGGMGGGGMGGGGAGGAGGSAAVGTCSPEKDFGAPCVEDVECVEPEGLSTGFCRDGVCCNGECNEQCEACTVEGNAGFCTIVGIGTPAPPVEGRTPCNGTGAVCAGVCNGTTAGACFYEEGKEPAPPTCTCTDSNCAETHTFCDDNGAINEDAAGTTVDCNGHKCADGESCATICETNADCLEDFICDDGGCREQNGDECDIDDQTLLLEPGSGTTDCAPYACPRGDSGCLKTCSSVDDCSGGAVCTAEGACAEQLEAPEVTSCSCRVAGEPRDRYGWIFLVAGAALLGARRHRR